MSKSKKVSGHPVAVAAVESRDRMKRMAEAAGKIDGWKRGADAILAVESVPTIFPILDHVIGVGGFPLSKITVIHGPSHEGKAHAHGTKILTPTGWKLIERLVVGDWVVAPTGQPCKVTAVHPRGELQLFRVTFSDGFSTECCAEHLWFTTTTNERLLGKFRRGPRPKRCRIPTGGEGHGSVKSVVEIIETLDDCHSIPTTSPVEFDSVGNLPIDPYLLGLLLGDGGFSGRSPVFSKPEVDLQERVRVAVAELGDECVSIDDGSIRINHGGLRSKLVELELWGRRSWEKFVPDLYLRASVRDRLELLRGLTDTDGSVDKDGGAVEFSSTSNALADAYVELARSLGAIVRDDPSRRTTFAYKGEKKLGRPSRRVKVVFNDGTIPVSSAKNLARWKGRDHRQFRNIVAVEPTRNGLATCISVDSPDRLYLCEGYTVTHNSMLALGLLRSFVEAGHYAALIDAERAITDQFARLVMGEAFDSPCFEVLPTNSYEKVRAGVRAWNDRIVDDRKSGRIPGDATGIVVVDSIRKLVPDKLWDKICKEMEDGIDGMRGGAGREKAKFNAAWMDELVPLISDGRTAFVAIAREHVVKGTGMFDRDRVEVGGGDSLKYDPSLTMRVTADEIWRGADKKKRLVGYRHPVNVIKTRFGARTTRAPEAAFHSSNGVESPVGLDRAHDLLELGQELGEVELKGAWYSAHVGGGVMERLGQGIEQAASKLRESPEWMIGLERVLREKF